MLFLRALKVKNVFRGRKQTGGMKMAVFCVVVPCGLVEVYQRFRGTCCLIALMMEAASTSEKLANFYQTTRRYNPEDSHLHTRRRENLRSYRSNEGHKPFPDIYTGIFVCEFGCK
jgi:hypothetical protein